jgi:methionyl-tRNA formyltransferase
MEKIKIVLLAAQGTSTNIVYNSLASQYNVDAVIIEERENMKRFLKRRVKRLGIFTVFGQVAFQIIITKILTYFSDSRIKKILSENELDTNEINKEKIINVKSVNDNNTLTLLQKLKPDLIIVNGTRIISSKILNGVSCKFINTHVGITPKYRGVHGTYWALVNNDVENSGVTVHFLDAGIDTGNIISQAIVTPSQKDNFSTYPYLQLAEGIRLLQKAVEDYSNKNIKEQISDGESNLYYHPTIFQYLYYRVFRKIK